MKFKIGDTVERCIRDNTYMQIGDIGIINSIKHVSYDNCDDWYTINGYDAPQCGDYLKLINAKINWKERLSK